MNIEQHNISDDDEDDELYLKKPLISKKNTEQDKWLDELIPIVPEGFQKNPLLFDKQVDHIKTKLLNQRVAKYLLDFEKSINNQSITICSTDINEIEQKRKELGEEKRKRNEEMEIQHFKNLQFLSKVEKNSLKRITKWFKEKENIRIRREKQVQEIHSLYKRALGKTFQKAEEELNLYLSERQKLIKQNYGKLIRKEINLMKTFKERYMWSRVPQQIQMKIKMIRGVKDKLSRGRYILLITIRDRIGGHVVSTYGKTTPGDMSSGVVGVTLEQFHRGRFIDLEIVFDQTLYLVCPPKQYRKPYMVFTFELVQMRGNVPGICVAWGAFPVQDSRFKIIDGKFKLPLLRGWLDENIDQYHKIQEILRNDLEMWMGNLYFEVKPLPKILYGKKENESKFNAMKEISDVKIEEEKEEEIDVINNQNNFEDEKKKHRISIKQIQQENENLETYSYGLPLPTGYAESMFSMRKGFYIMKAVLSDLGIVFDISTLKNMEFYITIFLIIISFFGTIQIHYFFQYLFLILFLKMPGVQYNIKPFYVDIIYQSETLSFGYEAIMTIIGPFGNFITLIGFILIIWILQFMRINPPRISSKFVIIYGICTFLDPINCLIIDCISQRFKIGDAFKLYIFATRDGSSGSTTLACLLTIALIISHQVISALILIYFTLYIFMNGQIIDVFSRVHRPNESFIIPHDLEVSKSEIEYVLKKCKRYRGENGEFRRIVVFEYTLTDPSDPSFKEITYHYIIYTVNPEDSNQKKVFRQFLWLHDGTLLEVFKDEDAIAALNMKMISTEKLLEEIESN